MTTRSASARKPSLAAGTIVVPPNSAAVVMVSPRSAQQTRTSYSGSPLTRLALPKTWPGTAISNPSVPSTTRTATRSMAGN